MSDLRIPNFMKAANHTKQKVIIETKPMTEDFYLDDEDDFNPSEIPVEPRISPKQACVSTETDTSMAVADNIVNEALTDAEKEALRKHVRAMTHAQMRIALEEIPMKLIIAHFDKKWEEAEVFRRNIAMAMGDEK